MLVTIIMATYTFIALRFIDCSLCEGERSGGRWDVDRLFGLGLCVVWPITVLVMLLVVHHEREIG